VRLFSRSTLVSLFTSALDFLTLVLLVEKLGVSYVWATWIGTIVGSLSNFTINKHWAFEAGRRDLGPQFLRFLPVQAGSSALQTLGVWGFTRFVGVPYEASKILVAVLVYLGWNFPLNRLFVFRKAPPAPAPAASPTSSPLP